MNTLRKGTTKHCVFGGCLSDSRWGPRVEFMSFPKACLAVRKKLIVGDKKHLQECSLCTTCNRWIYLCKRRDRNMSLLDVTKHTYICKKHFVAESGPCEIYPEPLPAEKVLKIRGSERLRKKVQMSDVKCAKIQSTSTSEDNNHETIQLERMEWVTQGVQADEVLNQEEYDPLFIEYRNYTVLDTHNMVEDCVVNDDLQRNNPEYQDNCSQTESPVKSNKYTQTNFCWKDMSALRAQNELLRHKNSVLQKNIIKMKQEAKRCKITVFTESLKRDEKKCKFYTNLYFNQLLALFAFLQPTEQLTYWNTKKKKDPKKKPLLTPFQELIITLVRLRTGLLIEDMSYRFNLSKSFISNLVITWVQHSYCKFNIIRPMMFASREKIKENLPAMFKRLKNVRVILDCAEFFCEVPSNFEHQGNVYSSYKAHTTFKVLIGCTPNGAVSFISDLFEGSISDKDIVKKSNLLDYLEPGDLVLADRGFDMHELTNAKKVSLNIPPFLKGRERLTAEEEIETKRIAKQRIYVEHVVGRLKRFRLLKKVLPLKMRGILSQIVFFCACLLNFQEPILENAAES